MGQPRYVRLLLGLWLLLAPAVWAGQKSNPFTGKPDYCSTFTDGSVTAAGCQQITVSSLTNNGDGTFTLGSGSSVTELDFVPASGDSFELYADTASRFWLTDRTTGSPLLAFMADGTAYIPTLSCDSANSFVTAHGGHLSCQAVSGSAGGTVTSLSAGTGITLTPNPITSTGSIALTTPVIVGNGGTGATSFTVNGVLFGNTASALQVTSQGAANTVLTANAGAPSFSSTPTIGTLTLSTGTPILNLNPSSGNQYELYAFNNVVTLGNSTGSKALLQFDAANRATLPQLVCTGGQLLTATSTGLLQCVGNVVYTTATNTAATSMTLDLSAATGSNAFKVPAAADLTTSANAAVAYDTTSNNLHSGHASADSVVPVTTVTPTNGNCVSWSVSGGSVKLADTGGVCGGTPGGGVLGYSASSLTLTAATRYVPVVGGGSPSTTETDVDTPAPSAATITNLSVSTSVAIGAGNTIAVTVRNNAASTALTCTYGGAVTTNCQDTTHSFNVVSDDLLTYQVVTTGTIIVSPTLVITAQYGTTGNNGTVNTGTINQVGYYAAAGTAVSGSSGITLSSTQATNISLSTDLDFIPASGNSWEMYGNNSVWYFTNRTNGKVLEYFDAADRVFFPQLACTGTNVLTATSQGQLKCVAQSGGGGSPGGSDTYVQFNDASAFNGISTFTFNKSTGVVTSSGYALANDQTIAWTGGTLTFSASPDAFIFNNDATFSEASPHVEWRDTSDNTAYQWHLDTAESYRGLTLWEGTDSGSGFVIQGTPMLQFNDSTDRLLLPRLLYQDGGGSLAMSSAGKVLSAPLHPCAVVGNLSSTDDNMGLGNQPMPVTVKSVSCTCKGTCTTKAEIALQTGAGSAMTHAAPTCSTTGTEAPTPVTGSNTLAAYQELQFNTTNSPSPTTDQYTICVDEIPN